MSFVSRRNLNCKLVTFILSLWIGFSRVSSRTVTIENRCSYVVWPGILSNAGGSLPADGGFELQPGKSITMDAPTGWSGRLWGRTGCNFASDGLGNCSSGDCGGKLQCGGIGADPPVTLVEFTLQGQSSAKDFYDVSLVDGFNLPLAITPKDSSNGTCQNASCSSNINSICPTELQLKDDGNVVSCKSACLAFQLPQYCCSGAYGNPNTCKPSNFSQIFKHACPTAYSYAYDDPTSIFTCSGASYDITFCPQPARSRAKRSEGSWAMRWALMLMLTAHALLSRRNL